jgi:hypothetical protein
VEHGVTRPEIGEVIEALLGSVADTGQRRDPLSGQGIVVTEAEIDLPLEASIAMENGQLVLRAAPPSTLMKTGFMAPVHIAHLRLVLDESSGGSE